MTDWPTELSKALASLDLSPQREIFNTKKSVNLFLLPSLKEEYRSAVDDF